MSNIDDVIVDLENICTSGNHQQVITLAQKLLDDNELNEYQQFDILYQLGKSQIALDKTTDATATFTQIKDTYPNKLQGPLELFQIYTELKDWQKILDIANELQSSFPNIILGYLWKADSQLKLGQLVEAQNEYETIFEKFPKKDYGLEGLIETSRRLKAFDKTVIFSDKYILKHPDKWQGYWWKGQAYTNLEEYDAAKASFNTLREDFPKQHRGLEGLISLSLKQKDWQNVVQLSETFILEKPKMWQGYWWKGEAHKNLEEYDAAKASFNTLREDFPKQHRGLEGLISLSLKQKDWQNVVQLSETFILENPKMWQGYWWKGEAHRNLEEYDTAEAVFNTLREGFPKQHQRLTKT